MLTAITRAVSPAIVNCVLSFIDRKPIDLATAQQQHHAYEILLGKLGARVISLPAEPDLPDSMFVEDPAIVLDELAVILPLGTETRRREAPSLAQALAKFRKLEYISLPGTLEGGDVLRIGRKLFVGLTARSNAEGIRQLSAILAPHHYEVIAVPVTSCLHLKSAVTHLGRNTLSPAMNGSMSIPRSLTPPTPWHSQAPSFFPLPSHAPAHASKRVASMSHRWTSPNSKKPNPA
jgi:dimethylargininase